MPGRQEAPRRVDTASCPPALLPLVPTPGFLHTPSRLLAARPRPRPPRHTGRQRRPFSHTCHIQRPVRVTMTLSSSRMKDETSMMNPWPRAPLPYKRRRVTVTKMRQDPRWTAKDARGRRRAIEVSTDSDSLTAAHDKLTKG